MHILDNPTKSDKISKILLLSDNPTAHKHCFVLGASDWGVRSWDGQSCSNGMARDPKGRVINAGRTEL